MLWKKLSDTAKQDYPAFAGETNVWTACRRNVFCFDDFNQTAIVLRYSAHIKPRKTIKPIKTENITHKHNVTLIVSS